MKTIQINTINMRFKCIALLLVIFASSCSDILDREPIAILDAGSYFQTGDDALQAVNAAYTSLLFNNRNKNFYWAFATITGDEAIPGGDGSRPGLVELEAFSHTPRTEEFNDFWKLEYKGINQCNLVLDNIGDIQMDEDLKNRIIGEALFLRSFYYFQLMQVFGEVPLYLEILPPDELQIPRSSQEEVLQQIIGDCETASALLPLNHDAANIGRPSKGSALALKAKAHLYQKNWAEVVATVAQIKALGVYQMVENYGDLYSVNRQNNTESVWEIQHTNLELEVGNFLNQWWFSRKAEGYGFAEANKSYVNMFEAGDPRRALTVASRDEPYFGLVYKSSFSSTGHGPVKFLQADSTVTQIADGDINYPAIRFAEVLLWEAEALVELGQINEAAATLELVRARARNKSTNPATTLPYIAPVSQDQMRQAVRHERAVELGFELHRFFDLVRWGIADQVLDGFVKGKHEKFPIPQVEMDLNTALNQNPGY